MIPPINSDINSLSPAFRKKFDAWWSEVIAKYPNAVVFECRRSQERQNYLYSQGRTIAGKIVTWTLTSNHKDGNAVDIVFRNNGKLERAGPYNDLIVMAKKYGIENLAPKELCHFQDNGQPFNVPTTVTGGNIAQADTIPINTSTIGDLKGLIDDKLFSGDMNNLTAERVLIVLGRVYNKLFTK